MLVEDALKVLQKYGCTVKTHQYPETDRWSAAIIGPDNKYASTPNGEGPSADTAIINAYCYWSGYKLIKGEL